MTSSNSPTATTRSWLVLLMLILVYMLNFLDRQIISILAVPIHAEFHLSDSQTGWLGGLAFGLFYSVLALPAAWIADRASRVGVMTAALVLWSGFTALCGMVGSFAQLFIARMGVGIGEAGGVAPAYSLIADLFPPKMRARALAVYSLGIPLGAAAGVYIGGLLASDWRRAFLIVGLAGLVLALPFRLLVREPKREPAHTAGPGNLMVQAMQVCAKPSFWLLSLGAGFASLVGYGLLFWFPSFLVRSLHFDLSGAGRFLALILLIGGVIGMSLGGVLADRLGAARKSAYALIPAAAFLASAPLYALGVTAHSSLSAFWLFLIPQALGLMWFGPILTAVQHLGPARTRSQVSALFLLINNLIGLGLGPWFFGRMSDLFRPDFGEASLKCAFLSSLGFYVLAALLLALAARRLPRDWVD